MRFLTNDTNDKHLDNLLSHLDHSTEAYIAIAFLKESGLNELIHSLTNFVEAGKKIDIITGQNFGLTEPKALYTLRNLFEENKSGQIYLANANKHTPIFHPKLYLFKNGSRCHVIAGSANVTGGGLLNNDECSILIDCEVSSTLWLDAKAYFDKLTSPDNAEKGTLVVIKQYETFYEQQRQHNKKAQPVPLRNKSQQDFNYGNLRTHFSKFDNKKRNETFKNKMYDYEEAKKVLDNIADHQRLTQKAFEPMLDSLVSSKGTYGWWHSGSLFRLRRDVYPYYKEFQELVRYIRLNKSANSSIVYKGARDKVDQIYGASVNYITEIMMTYNPEAFANLNKNPITVLRKEGGLNIKSSSESFTAKDYEEYCEIVKEISDQLGLRNMLEADSFFNTIYWKLDKKSTKNQKHDI